MVCPSRFRHCVVFLLVFLRGVVSVLALRLLFQVFVLVLTVPFLALLIDLKLWGLGSVF